MARDQNKGPKDTSWEKVGSWYSDKVGKEGQYYHQQIILPFLEKYLESNAPEKEPSILDLACGQGVLSRKVGKRYLYTGVDISQSLIKDAQKLNKLPNHTFYVGDITKPLPVKKKDYSFVTIVLALQNIEFAEKAIKNAADHLSPGGKLIIVLNHPCFRVLRQSSWGIDESKDIQYRRVDRYYKPLKIPIQAHPSMGKSSPSTWSFHHPISDYSRWLFENGFQINQIEEWCSDKVSKGAAAKRENRSRDEIPLFMCLVAEKRDEKRKGLI